MCGAPVNAATAHVTSASSVRCVGQGALQFLQHRTESLMRTGKWRISRVSFMYALYFCESVISGIFVVVHPNYCIPITLAVNYICKSFFKRITSRACAGFSIMISFWRPFKTPTGVIQWQRKTISLQTKTAAAAQAAPYPDFYHHLC